MGFLSGLKKAAKKVSKSVSSVAKKVSSGVKSVASTVGSGVKSVASTVGNKVSSAVSTVGNKITSTSIGQKIASGANIVGTNIKNSFSKDSIKAFVSGVAQGGLWNGIASAVGTTAMKSMSELDKSGEFNDDYAYKQYGFSSNAEMETAFSYGIDNAKDWADYQKSVGSVISSSDMTQEVAETGVVTVNPSSKGSAITWKDIYNTYTYCLRNGLQLKLT